MDDPHVFGTMMAVSDMSYILIRIKLEKNPYAPFPIPYWH